MADIRITQLPDGSIQITIPPGQPLPTIRRQQFRWDDLDLDGEIRAYAARTGAYPNSRSHGLVGGVKTWAQVHAWLATGGRESLRERCRRLGDVQDLYQGYTLPRYEYLIREYHERTGQWPDAHSPDTTKDGVTWMAVDFALRKHHRTTLKALGCKLGAPTKNLHSLVSKRSRGVVTELRHTTQAFIEALAARRPSLSQSELYEAAARLGSKPDLQDRIVTGAIGDKILDFELRYCR